MGNKLVRLEQCKFDYSEIDPKIRKDFEYKLINEPLNFIKIKGKLSNNPLEFKVNVVQTNKYNLLSLIELPDSYYCLELTPIKEDIEEISLHKCFNYKNNKLFIHMTSSTGIINYIVLNLKRPNNS